MSIDTGAKSRQAVGWPRGWSRTSVPLASESNPKQGAVKCCVAMKKLTVELLKAEASSFAKDEKVHFEPSLYGVNNGKAVGTYLEKKFRSRLLKRGYEVAGSSAVGLDFPDIEVDMKVTSARQPQSSCPFRSMRQRVYGLGYGLLIFVYMKTDRKSDESSNLDIVDLIYVDKEHTSDHRITQKIIDAVNEGSSADEIKNLLMDQDMPLNEAEAVDLAREIVRSPPKQGHLTISNALQWRLSYKRTITVASATPGVERIET